LSKARWLTRAPAASAMATVESVEKESKTWISSDQATEARQSGRSCCSLRVRMRIEIKEVFLDGKFVAV
jgi:hypothetical protein